MENGCAVRFLRGPEGKVVKIIVNPSDFELFESMGAVEMEHQLKPFPPEKEEEDYFKDSKKPAGPAKSEEVKGKKEK